MLLISVASTALLYRIASRLTGSTAVGALAGLIFALSPLSLYYGRMVLLDNIMVLWLLLAVDLLTEGEGLFALMGSGAAFGLAVLTKENALFFAPALGVVLYFASRERHFYRFGIWGWLYAAITVVSIYPLYALLKGELFGTDAFLVSPHGGHVNLLGAVEWQLSRTASHGSIIDYPHGQFWDYYFYSWAAKDAFIITAGVMATVFNVGVALADARLRRHYLMAAALCLSFALYLARGAVLLEFYIVPLLPFLALNIALAIHAVVRPLGRRIAAAAVLGMAAALALVFTQLEQTGRDVFTVGQTDVQLAQLSYVRSHIPARARMMIDDDLWVDLHDSGGGIYPVYRDADSHWKIAGDPAVRDVVFRRDWRRVDYVIASDQMPTTLGRDTTDHYHVALNAYVHSIPVWRDSVGGVTVEIRKVASKPALYRVWLRQQRRLEHLRSKQL
jgi:4-amino-4-deoxy-L-arabinose transferase-like glycosyltransferase